MAGRPLLVIVSGPPGAGKTTLAQRLGGVLELPVFTKDTIKEAAAEAFPEIDLSLSQRLGQASYRVLYALAIEVLRAGTGLIVESNFHRGASEPEVAALTELASACEVNCFLPAAVCVARYTERSAGGQRHRAHLDSDRLPALREGLASGLFEPLRLDIPRLRVETSAGYNPAFEEIVAFVQAVSSGLGRRLGGL